MILLCLACNDQSPLVGNWVGKDAKGKEVSLLFRDDGTFTARTEGDVLNGRYRADFSTSPAELDLRVEDSKPIFTIMTIERSRLTVQETKPGMMRPVGFTSQKIVYVRSK